MYKFDLPYKVLVVNTNAISGKYDENQVIDESSWPHCGYGEAGSIIFGRLSQNKKFVKGGQIVFVYGCWKVPNTCVHASSQAL